MTDYIIIAVIVVAASFGIYSAAKHFKGKSGCCGSGGFKLKRKKLKNVLYKKEFKVGGMHCENCKNRVEEVVNDIKGAAGRVDLKSGILTVSYAEEIDDSIIKAKIERVGYSVE